VAGGVSLRSFAGFATDFFTGIHSLPLEKHAHPHFSQLISANAIHIDQTSIRTR
jgi:hypothetical protein